MSRFEIFRVFSDMEGLHEAWRDRAEDLNRSRNEIGQIGKLQPGYAEKMLCDPPMKYAGKVSLPGMLKGTDSYLALVVDTNPAEGAIPAKQRKMRGGAVLLRDRMQSAAASIPDLKQALSDYMREIGAKGNMNGAAQNGGKRRAATMSKRARQRIATHAARIRWAKHRKS